MEKKEEYFRIKEILKQVECAEVKIKKGKQFKFPIYMSEEMAKTDISVLELSPRSQNCLRRASIETIGNLCERVSSSKDLAQLRNCGKTSVAEIMDSLFEYQYSRLKPEKRDRFLAHVFELNFNMVQ